MKYNVCGYNQEEVLKLVDYVPYKKSDGTEGIKKVRIDATDLVILRWFVDFYPNTKKMIIDGKEYGWVSSGYMLEQLPFLDITKRSANDRMKKLEHFGLIDRALVKSKGNYTYYRVGTRYSSLALKVDDSLNRTTEVARSNVEGYAGQPTDPYVGQTAYPYAGQPTYKDSSISDSSINDSSININGVTHEQNPPIENAAERKEPQGFSELWKMYPRKVGKANAREALAKAYARGVPFDDIRDGIELYARECEANKTEEKYIAHMATFLNKKRYEDYEKEDWEKHVWTVEDVMVAFKMTREDAESHMDAREYHGIKWHKDDYELLMRKRKELENGGR